MATFVVNCVTIDHSSEHDDCRSIESLGFPENTGGVTTRSPAEVYDWIEEHGHAVVVEHDGLTTELRGATHGGRKYVRTEVLDTRRDRLLEQPSC